MRRYRPPRHLPTVLLLLVSATVPGGRAAVAAGEVLVDRIAAVVDDDPIYRSDVERVLALGLVEPLPEEGEQELRRRVVDGLIEERLRLHEVERYGGGRSMSVEEVDRQVAAIRQRFGDGELDALLARLGLDEVGLRYLLTRQLRVLDYIEERLGPRVFVDLDDVRTYYETVLTPEMESRGAPLPPLDEVREDIRRLLRERRLNEEIAAWTAQLRLAADVEDHFDALDDEGASELPPVVLRLEEEGHAPR